MEDLLQRMYCKHCGWAADEGTAVVPYCPDCDERLQILSYIPSEKKQATEFLEKLKIRNNNNERD